jgi:hypothetical protein
MEIKTGKSECRLEIEGWKVKAHGSGLTAHGGTPEPDTLID